MIHAFEPPIIYVHGGAGRWKVDDKVKKHALEHLSEASEIGYQAMIRGNAIDGVVEAIKYLEDSGLFNAGIGSALTIKGCIEMDAGLMDGRSLRAGAVACISKVKNPISLARIVLERTDHILLIGNGAEELAKIFNLERRSGIPQHIIERYKKLINKIEEVKYWRKLKELLPALGIEVHGTVGAIALDSEGNVAAASSTGGVWLKLPGRVGDTPIVGAGFYADNRFGAATATGLGEYITLYGLSRKVVEYMGQGLKPLDASTKAINELTKLFGYVSVGVIALDTKGNIGSAFNTNAMPRAVKAKDLQKPITVFSKEKNI